MVVYFSFSTRGLQHGLEVLGDSEGSFRLGLDLVDGDAVCDLDEGHAVGKVDVKDSLEKEKG